jgi:uncharacterized membrane protein YdjX (TVP38/TMEM64 family)
LRNKIIIPFIIIVSVIIISFLLFDNMESFFTNMLQQAADHVKTYILVSFFVLTSDVLLPVPSSIVMFTNGYVLGTFYGTVLSLISLMAGTVIGYYLGKFTSLGFKSKSDDKANNIVSRYGALSILITRGIPVLSETISIICGYNKMPFKTYFLYNMAGYIPLCLLYAFCGSIGYDKNIFLLSFGCSILISAAFWFFGRKFISRSAHLQQQ